MLEFIVYSSFAVNILAAGYVLVGIVKFLAGYGKN